MSFDEESERQRLLVTLSAVRWLGPALFPFVFVPLAMGAVSLPLLLPALGAGLATGAITGFALWKRQGTSPFLSALGFQLLGSCMFALLIGGMLWGNIDS